MMKQYMKNKKSFFAERRTAFKDSGTVFKEDLTSSGVLVFLLITCLGLFSCSKFLEENPKDKLPEE